MGKTKLLTHSSMTCAKTCLKMYELKYVKGLRRQREETPLRVGSLVHLGLELGKIQPVQDYPDWCIEDEDQYKWDCDQALAQAMVQAYLEYWADDNVEVISREQEFYTKIINPETGGVTPSFVAAGKIDKTVKLPDGRLAIMEHKTTSDNLEEDSPYWRRLMMDQQISHYFIGAQDIGIDVETVLYDVIKRPSLQAKSIPILGEEGLPIVLVDETGERAIKKNGEPYKTASKGMTAQKRPETPEEYGMRVYTDINDRPEHYFCRREIPRLDSDVDEFLHELWQQQKMLQECHKNGYFFRNTSACFKWNRPCEYFDVCTAGGLDDDDEFAPLGFEFNEAHTELESKPKGENK